MTTIDPTNTLTIYPHRDAYDIAIRRLLTKDGSIIFGNTHLTVTDFLRTTASTQQAVISALSAKILIHNLLLRTPLKFYEKIKHLPGTAELFASTIGKLKKNLISPSILRSILERRGGDRENDLLTTYEHYTALLSARSINDEADLVAMALRQIKAKKSLLLNNAKAVQFSGFFEFDPGNKALITALKGTYPELRIDTPKHIDNSLFIKALGATDKALPEIKYLSAPSLSVQALYISRQIEALLRDGCPPDRIGVLSREDTTGSKELIFRLHKHLLKDSDHSATFKIPGLDYMIQGDDMLGDLPPRADVDTFIAELMKHFADTGKWGSRYRRSSAKELIAPSLVWLDSIHSALSEISFSLALTNDEEIDRQKFLNVLQMACSKGSREWLSSGELPILSLEFSKPVDVELDHLFVPNFNAGIFPSDARSLEFFTGSEFKDGTDAEALSEIFLNQEAQMNREETFFNHWLRTPKNMHFLSSMFDASGRDATPSPFINRIVKTKPVFKPVSESPRPEQNESLKTIARRVERETAILSSSPIIVDEKIKKDIRRRFSDHLFSVSQLESYANCPFTYFCDKVLNLEPEDEETPEVQADDRGKIMHKAFEDFFTLYHDLFMQLVADPGVSGDVRTVVEHLTDTAIEENNVSLTKRKANPVLIRNLRRHAIELVLRTIVNEAALLNALPEPLIPAKMEWQFGFTDDPLAIPPLSGDSPILIRGQIDRIDIDEENHKHLILDYKTGEVKTVPKAIREGCHLQLPVYVEAVSQKLLKDYEPLGGILLSVRNGKRKSGFIKKEFNKQYYNIRGNNTMLCEETDWNELKQTAIEAVRRHAEGIRNGCFEPDNSDCKDYCDYAEVCRRKHRGE